MQSHQTIERLRWRLTAELAWPDDARSLLGPVPDSVKGQDRIAWFRARESLYQLEADLFPPDED